MKKLLAICLTVFMVISLMPAAFAADPAPVAVSATGETWIEGETYTAIKGRNGTTGSFTNVTVTPASHIVSSSSYHGGKAMRRGISYSGGQGSCAYVEIPISVATAGKYRLTLNAPQFNDQYTRVYVGDASGAYSQVLLTTRAGGSTETQAFNISIADVDLTTESTKLKFEITSTSTARIYLAWDYIMLKPVSAPVTVSGTTRIEAENYPIFVTSISGAADFKDNAYQNRIVNDANFSGGAYISRGVKTTSSNRHTSYIEIPFTAPEDGLYTIKVNLKHYASQSMYRFSLNGGSETAITTDLTATGWDEATIAENVTAGANTIKINSLAHSGAYYYLDIDYVEIEKISSEFNVGNAAPTTIQAESYPYTTCVHSDTSTHFVVGTVADGIVTANCTAHEDTNGTNSWKVKLNVATTGVYEIKTVAGGALAANGGVEIILDSEAIITDTVVSTELETFAKRVYMAAGMHEYSYTAKSISGKATATIDYVEITPVVAGSADPDTTGAPVISVPAEILTGTTATVSYTYAEGNTNPEGESILRVMYKDGLVWRVGLTETVTGGTGSIELPNNLEGYEVAIEFIPVDSEGKMGPLTSTGSIGSLERAVAISTPAINLSGSDFNATVTITNNSAILGPQNICVILVQYDADGAMLAVTNAAVSAANGTPQTPTLSFAKETGATKVQMFIWNGTGYLDAGVSTYGTPVTYMVP